MFIDELHITLRAGNGGDGKMSFYPKEKAGPDGGNGGRGGNFNIVATSDLSALSRYAGKKELAAENGVNGGDFLKYGRAGKDLTVEMPVGLLVVDKDTGEQFELTKVNQKILICKGGRGGFGNAHFKSSKLTTPKFAEKGVPGQTRQLDIILKLIADFGLIGLPNAGKSSLLNELTNARVKTASYPFTTLEPNLGVLNRKIIADIPGLIEGASEGKGLGIKFLKHIEKVEMLLHCISAESEDVVKDYTIVRGELKKFNKELLAKKEIMLVTKHDMVTAQEAKKKVMALKKVNKNVFLISIHDFAAVEKLKKMLV